MPVMKDDFSELLNVITIFIGAFIPSSSTLRAIRMNDDAALDFLVSYWVVFGVWTTLEAIASLFNILAIIPAYAWLKLFCFAGMYAYGHDFFFDILSPLADETEPIGAKILAYGHAVVPLAKDALNFIFRRLTMTILRSRQQAEEDEPTARDSITSLSSLTQRGREVSSRSDSSRPNSLRDLRRSVTPPSSPITPDEGNESRPKSFNLFSLFGFGG